MLQPQHYSTAHHFDNLFNIFSNARFLNKEGLGGELPFFIHSFPVAKQPEVETAIQSLFRRLQNNGIDVVEINLYRVCIDILKRENLFEQIRNGETAWTKQRLLKSLIGPLNIDRVVMPEIHQRLSEQSAKIVFLTGIGAAYPIIRSHTILNNLQTLVGDLPLVMFFPGTYNNHSLTLFDQLKDDNYYRAHNLNDYKL